MLDIAETMELAPAARTGRRGYAICSEPRSGTTYLCSLLSSTGRLGEPREFFNPIGALARSTPGYGPSRMVPTVLDKGATANGVYAVKVFSDVFANPRLSWAERLPNLKFVHMERLDLLGQAISLARAVQTGQYVAGEPVVLEPHYDRPLIAYCLRAGARGQARWRQFFARNGIAPLHLTYEELVASPAETVARIARLVEVDPPAVDPAAVAPRVQRDDLSEAWRERFVRESADRGRLDPIDIDAPLAFGRVLSRLRLKLLRLQARD